MLLNLPFTLNRTYHIGDNKNNNKNTDIACQLNLLTKKAKNACPRNASLNKARFVVIDTETTGFGAYSGDEIISVGATVIEKEKLTGENFHRLVNPRRPIPQEISRLTGITNEMAAGAPDILCVLKEFLEFAKPNSILVGHAIYFDLAFINLKLRRFCHSRIYHPTLDTQKLSCLANLSWTSRNLDDLLAYYRIPIENRHTALGDARMTAKLFLAFLALIKQMRVATLKDLEQYMQQQYQFTFAKAYYSPAF